MDFWSKEKSKDDMEFMHETIRSTHLGLFHSFWRCYYSADTSESVQGIYLHFFKRCSRSMCLSSKHNSPLHEHPFSLKGQYTCLCLRVLSSCLSGIVIVNVQLHRGHLDNFDVQLLQNRLLQQSTIWGSRNTCRQIEHSFWISSEIYRFHKFTAVTTTDF